MKRDKPNRNFSGTPQGPRAYTPASVRRFAPLSYLRSGPAGCPWSFNLFFYRFHGTDTVKSSKKSIKPGQKNLFSL